MVQWSSRRPRAGVTEIQAARCTPDSLCVGPCITPTPLLRNRVKSTEDKCIRGA